MPDMEKAIKGLECCTDPLKARCPECPYYPCYDQDTTSEKLLADALELLKEQEPLKPFRGNSGWSCSACGNLFSYPQEYCDVCRRQVKWDG